jgi:non-ribosomal peptide synthetase component E (peptide arylation enzyme)
MGEISCAAVVPSGNPASLEELVTFLKEKKIAPYKLPQRIMIYNELPLAGDTKIDKKQIRADVIEQMKAEGAAV